ncbi:MAG: heme-binding protein, partial [Rhodococcus sp.]|nr:heme-binding protein [Rhodococcus sp. (in: high G+C Gram-positive bacteria)]
STTSITATQQPAATGDSAIVTQNRLSADAAVKAAGAALAKCRADGLGFVTVSVVDRAGNVIAMVRGDNAAQHTVEASREKAYTSAAFGADTSDLSQRTKGEGSTIADLPGTLFLAGGVTLKAGAGSIAGIGVGGAPDGMQDQACAAAGRDAIASSLG